MNGGGGKRGSIIRKNIFGYSIRAEEPFKDRSDIFASGRWKSHTSQDITTVFVLYSERITILSIE